MNKWGRSWISDRKACVCTVIEAESNASKLDTVTTSGNMNILIKTTCVKNRKRRDIKNSYNAGMGLNFEAGSPFFWG